MPVAILHFGQEINGCFPFLRQRGYFIHCVGNYFGLDQIHKSGNYDLVSSTDAENDECLSAAEEARSHLLVPAILFQVKWTIHDSQVRQFAKSDSSDYDLLIAADELPQSWISKLDELVALGQRLRGASRRLIANSIEHMRDTRTVSKEGQIESEPGFQREQDHMSMPIPNMLADRILKCGSCGESFVFPAGEQLLHQLHGLIRVPDRCSRCNSDREAR